MKKWMAGMVLVLLLGMTSIACAAKAKFMCDPYSDNELGGFNLYRSSVGAEDYTDVIDLIFTRDPLTNEDYRKLFYLAFTGETLISMS